MAAILQMIQEQNQVSLEGSELESEGFLNEIFKMDTIKLPVTSNIGKQHSLTERVEVKDSEMETKD